MIRSLFLPYNSARFLKITNLQSFFSLANYQYFSHGSSPISRREDRQPLIQWARDINSQMMSTSSGMAGASATASNVEAVSDCTQKITRFISENRVTVFSKSTCPFCSKVKRVFETLNVDIFVYELNENEDGPAIQAQLLEMTKQRTVPNVFVNKQHVGGCDAVLKTVTDGSILELLAGDFVAEKHMIRQKVYHLTSKNDVMVFLNSGDDQSEEVKALFKKMDVPIFVYELDRNEDGHEIHRYLIEVMKQATIPSIFVRGEFIGGLESVLHLITDGKLKELLDDKEPLIQKKVRTVINDNNVVVFSKTTCPYSTRAKAMFDSLKIRVFAYELNKNPDGSEIEEHLVELTKNKALPFIFVSGKYIGGGEDALKLVADGSLNAMAAAARKVDERKTIVKSFIAGYPVTIFSKTNCSMCTQLKEKFDSLNIQTFVYELDKNEDGPAVEEDLLELVGENTVPRVFVGGEHIGGYDETLKAIESEKISTILKNTKLTGEFKPQYDYDVFVIGGGSGGIAAAKEAAAYGKRVGLADFVTPSAAGTTWGLGGTCVNVGCIPKKLFHQASLLGELLHDAESFGWEITRENINHNWLVLIENIQKHIKSLNFGYRKELNKYNIKYFNSFAEIVTPNKLKLTKKNGNSEEVTATDIIISVGCRPTYLDIPGKEFAITSDDLFSMKRPPGKTLIVGASYIGLECGGFLRGLGFDVTIMVRSILLRGFDRQMAELVGTQMESIGVNFAYKCNPLEIINQDGTLCVRAVCDGEEILYEGFDTVIFAVGREACTWNLGLHNVDMKLNPKNKKIIVDSAERTSVPNIHAVGDVVDGKPELTPVAIQAGKYLAQRLVGAHKRLMNYRHIPTTVFTPLEYGSLGLSEEDAVSIFGRENVIVYHNSLKPLEHVLSRDKTYCYAKLICIQSIEELVVGFHVLCPNAGEITQGFAIALKLSAKKKDFNDLVGIHPTIAEVFTSLEKIKTGDEAPPSVTGC